MRPWQHAKSSASGTMRHWRDDLPIHEFLDLTKAAHPDLRHRLVLHNADLGPFLAEQAFSGRADARAIALRHVDEDMGGRPSLADWLRGCALDHLPHPPSRRGVAWSEELIAMVVRERRLADDSRPRAVLALLTLPIRLCPDVGDVALAILCNSAGPSIVRQVLGPPDDAPALPAGKVIFDPAWAAEAMIYWLMGNRIPTLGEVVAAVREIPRRRGP
jgi:hypothetical protein